MDRIRLERILDKYLHGNPTSEEKKLLDDLFDQRQKVNASARDFSREEKEKIREELFLRLTRQINRQVTEVPLRSTWPLALRVAASILLVAGISAAFFLLYPQNSEPEYFTTTTSPGQKTKIVLSDGSIIHLNSESSLKYPREFSNGSRTVELSGEAFFEIERNVEKPFIVNSGTLSTQVLGTSFNIRSYQDQPQSVTVVSGRVKVYPHKDPDLQGVVITRDQQAVYNRENAGLGVRSVSAYEVAAWKDHRLIIDNQPLVAVASIVERWYGIPVEIDDPAIENCLFTTDLQDEPLVAFLEDLKLTLALQYHFQDSTLHLSGKGCN